MVATYRNDERPALRDELAGMESIDLARLPESAIAALSATVLGEAGRRPATALRWVAPRAVERAAVAPRSRSAIPLAATLLLVAVVAAYGLLVVWRAASSRSAIQYPTATGAREVEPARTLDSAAPVVAPTSATASALPTALPTAAVRVTPSPKPARRLPLVDERRQLGAA